jgi:hypothetical protein
MRDRAGGGTICVFAGATTAGPGAERDLIRISLRAGWGLTPDAPGAGPDSGSHRQLDAAVSAVQRPYTASPLATALSAHAGAARWP